jgi:hypothetical protein
MAHVIVPDEPTRVSFVVTTPASTGPFAFAFSYFDTDDVEVYNGDSLVAPADYTLTPTASVTGGYEGGSITLDVAVSNTTITVLRNVPIERETDFPTAGAFPINTLNTWLDKTYAILQQLATKIGRTLRQPTSDAVDIGELPAKATRATKVLAFDSDGDPVASTMTLSAIEAGATTAAASAVAAQAAQTAAEAAQTAAEAAEATALAAAASITLPLPVASGGTGQTNAASAFGAIKQAATETASGVLEIATAAETTTGTDDTRAITPLKLTTFAPATATPDTGADSVIFLDATDNLLKKGTFPSTGLAAASQAEMETATSTAVATTPGRQHHHPGHPKAWVNFNGTGTIAIRADHGVASLTDHGTGEYSVTFDTAFSSANYCAIGICDRTINTTHGTEGIQTVTFGTGAFRFICASAVPTATDQEYVAMAFWGDQ